MSHYCLKFANLFSNRSVLKFSFQITLLKKLVKMSGETISALYWNDHFSTVLKWISFPWSFHDFFCQIYKLKKVMTLKCALVVQHIFSADSSEKICRTPRAHTNTTLFSTMVLLKPFEQFLFAWNLSFSVILISNVQKKFILLLFKAWKSFEYFGIFQNPSQDLF